MITLHNVHGQPFAVNGALVERVNGGVETHVLLVSGTNYIVTESLEDVVRLQREDRAMVQAMAAALGTEGVTSLDTVSNDPPLRLVAPVTSEHDAHDAHARDAGTVDTGAKRP